VADLTSNLIVRLIDGVSAPARAAGHAIRGMRDSVAAASGRIATAQTNVRAAVEANAQRMDAMRGRMFGAAAGAYVLTKAISAPISAAMDFESAMADVRKVVDFDTPAAFKAFQTDVIAMSKRIPMAAKDLSAIVASAGQAGIPRDELLRFTEMAAKVGIAFDISADQAGESLAKMMTGLGLSITEVSALSDAMNHLSNNQASTAADILDVVRRVGATAKQYGFAAEEVSAFASAMLAAGAESEVAATSFRNMGKALSKGSSATNRQAGALQTLGLDAVAVAKRMQEDAVGTTIDVLERIGKLPAEMQAAVSSDLFGDEARALGPLLTNLDLLRTSLGLVADETKYLGSAQKEYEVRSKTAANNLQLFRNQITAASIAIGNALLPGLTATLEALRPFVEAVERLATDFPELTSGIVAVTAGLMGLRLAAIGAGYAGLLLKGGLLTALVPALSLAKGVTRLGKVAGKAASPVRRLARVFRREVPRATVASVAGMTLVDQAVSRTARTAKAASATMIKGMSAVRVANAGASMAMIAGMGSSSAAAASAAAAQSRRGIAGAFRGVGASVAAVVAAPIAAALRGLPAVARVAAKGVKLALLGSGIGAVLVGIGAAATWVANNWEGITVAVEAFSGEFGRSMKELYPDGEPGVVRFIREIVEGFDTLTGAIDPDGGKWAQWGIAAGKQAVDLTEKIEKLIAAFTKLFGFVDKISTPSPIEKKLSGYEDQFKNWIGGKVPYLKDVLDGPGAWWEANTPDTGSAAVDAAERLAVAERKVAEAREQLEALPPPNPMPAAIDPLSGPRSEIKARIAALTEEREAVTRALREATEGLSPADALQAALRTAAALAEKEAEIAEARQRLASLPPANPVLGDFDPLAPQRAAIETEMAALSGQKERIERELAAATSLLPAQAQADMQAYVAAIRGQGDAAITEAARIAARLKDTLNITLTPRISLPNMPTVSAPSVAAPEARARGGPVRAGEEYLVGEEGPELFRPRRSGEIVPNGAFEPPEEVYRSLRPAAAGQEASRSLSIGDIVVHVTGVNADRPADVGRQIGEAIRRRLDGEFADVFG